MFVTSLFSATGRNGFTARQRINNPVAHTSHSFLSSIKLNFLKVKKNVIVKWRFMSENPYFFEQKLFGCSFGLSLCFTVTATLYIFYFRVKNGDVESEGRVYPNRNQLLYQRLRDRVKLFIEKNLKTKCLK